MVSTRKNTKRIATTPATASDTEAAESFQKTAFEVALSLHCDACTQRISEKLALKLEEVKLKKELQKKKARLERAKERRKWAKLGLPDPNIRVPKVKKEEAPTTPIIKLEKVETPIKIKEVVDLTEE